MDSDTNKLREEAKRLLLVFANDLETIAQNENTSERQIHHASCKADAIIARIENKKFFQRLS